ncbi:Guanylate kinase [Oribacterium sp. KHPX15]|uniref:guanylate kinase n=1 Tax=Oribacterium sp. KHPX15 TaxID=1855342 RepID=UPI00089B96B0|nr:guanylate kinase [Oribacterium sp. KHPX15]SEA47209.1 Guanylate kinase [Oribacterium sp. KHPX15]
MIYYLFGKSASGKDTIYKRLKELNPSWKEVTPYTTRPIREGESEGVEYHFVNDARIEEFRKAGKIIEKRTYNTVYGPWTYGTMDDGQIDLGSGNDYLMIGVLQSYISTRDYFGKENVMPIYIEVPDDIRLERAKQRELREDQPKLDEMMRRFNADNEDFSEEKLKEADITKRYVNIVLEDCIDEIIKDTGKPNI